MYGSVTSTFWNIIFQRARLTGGLQNAYPAGTERPLLLRIVECDPAELVGVILSGIKSCQNAFLICFDTVGLVRLVGVDTPESEVRFGPDDKVYGDGGNLVQATEVHASSVENVPGVLFVWYLIHTSFVFHIMI